MTNLRETPYSLKDGDVVAVVDRLEDEFAQADLSRADDEVRPQLVRVRPHAHTWSGGFVCVLISLLL